MNFTIINMLRILALVSFYTLFSQEMPPIQNFSSDIYAAGNQNWKIAQSDNNNMYFANNEGLLEYNGSKWKLYPSPNNTIIRSVKIVNDIIYTGCFMEFGFWKRDAYGELHYKSLVPLFKGKMIADEQIWNILSFDKSIVFQSFENLYIYDLQKETVNLIPVKTKIQKVFKIGNSLLFQGNNGVIYTIEQGKYKVFINNDLLKGKRIVNIFQSVKGLVVITDSNGFFLHKNKKLEKWKISLYKSFKSLTIYSAVSLENGNLVLGTISNGIIYLSSNGEIISQFNQNNGLGNNTILSLFVDENKNIWAGLDNGIDVINLKSPISIYNDAKGVLGTVYTSVVYKSRLYLGTNQGLFSKKINSNDKFKLIKGSYGQVWSLITYKNELFCGHNLGIFLVNKDKVDLISNILGTWDIKPIPNLVNTLLIGSYNGFYVMERKDKKWVIKNKIDGFDISSRFFEFTSNHDLWVNHEYKGVYHIVINNNYSKVETVKLEKNIPKGKSSSIVKYKNQLLYAYKNGVFRKKNDTSLFVYDSILSPIIKKDNYISGKMIVDESNKLWLFSKNNITYVSDNQLTNSLNLVNIPILYNLRKGMTGFENISLIKDNSYLLGTSNGYLKINLPKVKKLKQELHLNSIQINDKAKEKIHLELGKKIVLKSNQNSIIFDFSVPNFDRFFQTEYQYKLIGLYDDWSSWTKNSTFDFENLKHNDYTLMVRAKVGNTMTNQIDIDFKINKPWLISNQAIVIYALLLLLVLYALNKVYMWYYKKQNKHKELANDRLIMQIKNEKLNLDIEGKNRELAISTMSIIKKNKVLSSIKKELVKNDSTPEIKSVIRLIDRNLNNKKDWKFFEQAFNNADKGFLNKVKQVHPDLTPNDLRFCAYLRLNLSSKEIAPLLNISVRSIEIKRYRLRKKMNLDHSTSLVKYILNL